jgi:hypothetical protein
LFWQAWLLNFFEKPMKPLHDQRIAEGPFSDSFKSVMQDNGYETLQQLMVLPLTELAGQNWFTEGMMEELYAFLQEQGR